MTILFAEPRRAARDLLRELLASRSEAYVDGVTVSTKEPSSDDQKRALPWVQVKSDGSFRDSRLDGRASVRVLVWHRDEGLGQDLALLAEALLLDASSHAIRGVSPISGAVPTTDPDTGEPLSYFTVTARLRPQQV